jgi:hypothetical protein
MNLHYYVAGYEPVASLHVFFIRIDCFGSCQFWASSFKIHLVY